MLQYPEYFAGDLDSKDTNLFPLIVIGSLENWLSSDTSNNFHSEQNAIRDYLLLSTTNFRGKVIDTDPAYNYNFLPLIINISGVKESVDFNKRTHKISRSTITISNAEYNGSTFDTAINSIFNALGLTENYNFTTKYGSIIGMPVSMFWASQSTTEVMNNISQKGAFKVFTGVIREIKYSKNTSQLIIEDSTSTFIGDKQFPKIRLADEGDLSPKDNVLGLADDVPSEYKGMPVPVVYGNVDNSPCVVINEVDPVYGNPDHPSKVPTIYCDNNDSGTKFKTDSGYFSWTSEDVETNFNCISFLSGNDSGTYTNIPMFHWRHELLPGSGTQPNDYPPWDRFPRLYGYEDNSIAPQYYFPSGPNYEDNSNLESNKLIVASVPRLGDIGELEATDEQIDASNDLDVSSVSSSLSDNIVLCNAILHPNSARIMDEGDSYTSSFFGYSGRQYGYNVDYIRNSQNFGPNVPYDNKILIWDISNRLPYLLRKGETAYYHFDALVNIFYSGYYSNATDEGVPNFSYNQFSDLFSISLTLPQLPNYLNAFPIHYTFTGALEYSTPSKGLTSLEVDGTIYGQYHNYLWDGYNPELADLEINCDAFNDSGSYAKISFGLTQIDPTLYYGATKNKAGEIYLVPSEGVILKGSTQEGGYLLDGSWGGVDDDGYYLNRVSGYKISGEGNYSCVLNAPYDPVLTFCSKSLNPFQMNTELSAYSRAALVNGRLDKFSFLAQFYVGSFKYTEEQLFAYLAEGRLGSMPRVPEILNNLLNNELELDSDQSWNVSVVGDDVEYIYWSYAVTVNEHISVKKFMQDLLSVSPYIMRYNHIGGGDDKVNEVQLIPIKKQYTLSDIESSSRIMEEDIMDFKFSSTKFEDIHSEVIFHYNWDYGNEKFKESISFGYKQAMQFKDTQVQYSPDYYGKSNVKTLIIDDDRGKYIRNKAVALEFAKWIFYQNCNQHLKINITLPLKYMNNEVGDIVSFDKMIHGNPVYGINYSYDSRFNYPGAPDKKLGAFVNGQQVYPLFMINSISKNLDSVQIECTQLHNLNDSPDLTNASSFAMGCRDSSAWNYNPEAVFDPSYGQGCVYPGDFIVPEGDWGCPEEAMLVEEQRTGETTYDHSLNYAGNGNYSTEFEEGDNVFISNTEEDFNNLISVPEGPAYQAWVLSNAVDGTTRNYTEGGPKIYNNCNCIWEESKPHVISHVKLLLVPQEESNPSLYKTIATWNNIHDNPVFEQINLESNQWLDDGQYPLNMPELLDSDIYTHNIGQDGYSNNKLQLRFYFKQSNYNNDFTFTGMNKMQIKVLADRWMPNLNDAGTQPTGGHYLETNVNIVGPSEQMQIPLIENFTKYDSINFSAPPDTSEEYYYWIASENFIPVEGWFTGMQSGSFAEEYWWERTLETLKITYTLEATSDPQHTELLRSTESSQSNGYSNSPLTIKGLASTDYSLDPLAAMPVGDLNNDLRISVLDFVHIINHITGLAQGDDVDLSLEPFMDINADGVVNILDIIYFATFILDGDINMTVEQSTLFKCREDGGIQSFYDWTLGPTGLSPCQEDWGQEDILEGTIG